MMQAFQINRSMDGAGARFLVTALLLGCGALGVTADDSQSILLKDVRKVGDLQRVQVSLKVGGKLRAAPIGDGTKVPEAQVAANGWMTYQERLLALRPATETEPRGAVSGRYYEAAQAKMRIDDHEETVTLNEGQNIILARSTHTSDFVSAKTALSQAELEMIMVPGNGLAVYNLLPSKAVSVGETWAHTPQELVALLNLDEITVCDARSRLVDVQDGLARMQFVATVMGRADGSATEVKVTGDYRYDLRWQRINWLSMVLEEDRASSAATPGFVVNAELKMLAAPMKECAELNPQTLEQVARVYKEQERLLRFESSTAGLRLMHGPDWKLINDRPESLSFRMVDGSNTIAQCNVHRLKKRDEGRRLALETFQSDIQKALDKRFGRFATAREFDRKDGYHVLHVTARGVVEEIPVQWVYYHLTSPEGECASYVYTMEMSAAEKFASAEQAMVDSLQLLALAPPKPSGGTNTAGQPPKQPATANRTGANPAGGVRR